MYFFYSDYFAGKLLLGKKDQNKTRQKIPEIILKFLGNPGKLFSGNDNSINVEPGI